MQVLNSKFKVGKADSLSIDIYADTHLGSKSVDESLLKRHIAQTKELERKWVFLGDGIEGVLPNDRRFNSQNVTDWVWDAYRNKQLISAEYERWADLFSPIASQCLFYARGDGKHNRHENIDDCREKMLASLGIPGSYQLVYYVFSIYRTSTASIKVPLVFHHGYFAGRTASNKVIHLERCLNMFPEAWGFFCGHGHTKVMTPPIPGIVEREGKVSDLYRRGAMTGSYLKTFAEDTVGYGEDKLSPVALGRITASLSPFNKESQKRLTVSNI